jgi:hypothetical protein
MKTHPAGGYTILSRSLADTKQTRKLIGKTIEVAEYPDGRIELWADGAALPYIVYVRPQNTDIAPKVFRNCIMDPLTTQRSSIPARHGNGQPRLVNELQLVDWIVPDLFAVSAPCQTYARCIPFCGV